MQNLFSLWLVPIQSDTDYLGKIINTLGKKYDAPTFQPHLTLHGGVDAPLELITRVVEKSITSFKPMSLNVEKIDYSEVFFKTLFIQMKQSAPLSDLFSKLYKPLSHYSEYTFAPHISLLYKKMPEEEKKKLAETLRIKKTILLDRVFIITTADISKGWNDIEHWQIVKEYKL